MKLNKIYKLEIQLPSENGNPGAFLTIRPPITIEFNIDRRRFSSSNKMDLKIYNLSEETRSRIFRDRFDRYNPTVDVGSTNQPRFVRLYAGYEYEAENLSLIFNGALFYAFSRRRGPEFVTELECMDLDIYQYVRTSTFSLDKGVDKREIIKKLYVDLVGQDLASTGVIGNFSGLGKRGQVLTGTTIKLLDQVTNGNFYMDLGRPVTMLPGETFDNPDFRVLSAESGLLNTPAKSDTRITVQLIFTPNLQVGQKLIVNGYRDTQYNSAYVVVGIRHSGIISGTHDAQTTTHAVLYNGAVLKDIPLGVEF